MGATTKAERLSIVRPEVLSDCSILDFQPKERVHVDLPFCSCISIPPTTLAIILGGDSAKRSQRSLLEVRGAHKVCTIICAPHLCAAAYVLSYNAQSYR